MNVEGTIVPGQRGDLKGVVVLTDNGNGSGVLSATFYSPDLEAPSHISKIVPETQHIYDYPDLIEAIAMTGFVANAEYCV